MNGSTLKILVAHATLRVSFVPKRKNWGTLGRFFGVVWVHPSSASTGLQGGFITASGDASVGGTKVLHEKKKKRKKGVAKKNKFFIV